MQSALSALATASPSVAWDLLDRRSFESAVGRLDQLSWRERHEVSGAATFLTWLIGLEGS